MKTLFLLINIIALSACSTIKEANITQTDINRYEVTKSSANYFGPGVLQKEITREATRFCNSLKKRLHIISVHETKPPFAGSKQPLAELKFECRTNKH